jgi:hypothetical protein
MTTDVTIDGNNYRTGQLSAKQQFHVARRLAPLITKMGVAMSQGMLTPQQAPVQQKGTAEQDAEDQQAAAAREAFLALPIFEAVAQSLSELSDEECDYVIRVCMSVVSREQSGHWIGVWNKAADQLQFTDISMPAMMQLTMTVLQDNLGSFMPAQPAPGNRAATTGQSVH